MFLAVRCGGGGHQLFGIEAVGRHLLAQRLAGAEMDGVAQLLRLHQAEGGARSEMAAVTAPEPTAAFLRSDRHDRDVPVRLDSGRFDRGLRGQPRDDAGGPVEIAAFRDRVQMRSCHHLRRRPVAARQGVVGVAGQVGGDFEAELARRFGEHVMGQLLAVAVGSPRHAIAIGGFRGEPVEQPLGQRHAVVDRLGEAIGLSFASTP